MNDKHPSVRNCLDLSTSHMPHSKPDFGTYRHVDTELGYVMWFSPDTWEDETEDPPAPKWLVPVLTLAAEQGAFLINFDRDAEEYPDLPHYEW